MIYNLVDRAIHLSSKKFHKNNIEKVRFLLKNNSYPDKFIEKYIKIRLNKINSRNSDMNDNNCESSRKCIVLLYVSGVYERVSLCLKKYSIDTVSKISNNLSNVIVKGNDRTFRSDKNNVVYKVNCSSCSYSYVGQSKHSFDIRKGQHQKQKGSVVYQHINDNNHQYKDSK